MFSLIIIRGPLGVGKTTVSKLLANRIDGEYISIDGVLEQLKLDNGEGEGIPLKNFLTANELVIPKIKKAKDQGRTVIIDGNFYHKEQLEDLVSQVSGNVHVFTLKCPLQECITRDRGRINSYGEDAARAVYMMVSRFDYGQNINTSNRSASEVVNEIIDQIRSYS